MAADTARTLDADKTDGELELDRIFALQKKAYASAPFPSYDQRAANLDKLIRLTEANEEKFIAAINADFGNRAKHETIIAEIIVTVSGAKLAKKSLKKWMRPPRRCNAASYAAGKEPHRTATAWRRRHHRAVELPDSARPGAGRCSACRGK